AQDHVELLVLAVSQDGQFDVVARLVELQDAAQRLAVHQLDAVDLQDHGAFARPGLVRGRAADHRRDVGAVARDRVATGQRLDLLLQAHAKEGVPGLAAGDQVVGEALDEQAGYRKPDVGRVPVGGRVHADDVAIGVGQRATAVARVDGRVGLEDIRQALAGTGHAAAGGDVAVERGDDPAGHRS